MKLFDISAILITASALGSYVNYKWIKLPSSIGLLLLAMAVGLLGIFLNKIGWISHSHLEDFLANINFKDTVFHGMLSFLLFAGALQINIKDLKSAILPIAITATISTLISTVIIGFIFFLLANSLGFSSITLLYALLFGAILSPTDPIAALSIIKKMNISKYLETTIIGESLFNDCVAIVFFLVIIELIHAYEATGLSIAIKFIFLEVGGGILFGALIGWIAYQMLLRINDYHVELLLTLAVATGGYTLADKLDFSAPLSMVIAGIIIGNHGRYQAMSEQTRKFVDLFWDTIDQTLNAVLFFLIGLEMMVISANSMVVLMGLACIVIALAARYISLAIPLVMLKAFAIEKHETLIILSWGGLRGALSIAMVLSMQEQPIKELFLPCIYFVVVFSIAVQGLTLSKVIKMTSNPYNHI